MLRRLTYEIFYFRRPPWDTGISPPELMAFIDTHVPGRALDLGCGTGTNAITLAKHGWQVVGVDFVERAIRTARHKAKKAGLRVDFRAGDITRLGDFSGPFELILDIGCLHSLSVQQKAVYVENLRRWLAPQGTFLLYAFIVPNPQEHDLGLTPDDLNLLSDRLHLSQRVDGATYDQRASAWFTYRR